MRNLREEYWNNAFSHIYVETAVREHPRTRAILAKLPGATVVEIAHYKDVFCRNGQNTAQQRRAQSLILAAKRGTLLYEGAPVCQNFGNSYFYYTSCVMNCVFDCAYCYLKGMYPSANLVVFVNLEDIFAEVKALLRAHPLYLCVSYDADLPALEWLIGYVKEWRDFAARQENLVIEIRTKCANPAAFGDAAPVPGVIYAFTLSPQAVIDGCERRTPPLDKRLFCAASLLAAGCRVRLCFDPMIYLPDWRRHYADLLGQVNAAVDWGALEDVSVGSFRISQEYLKKMRRQEPDCAVVWYPFQNENGYYHYPDRLKEEMEGFLAARLAEYLPKEKIFRWDAQNEN